MDFPSAIQWPAKKKRWPNHSQRFWNLVSDHAGGFIYFDLQASRRRIGERADQSRAYILFAFIQRTQYFGVLVMVQHFFV